MSDITEIYICKDGQELRDGKLEYSSHVETRDDAEADARRRCNLDPSIARIAYYAVNPSGSFRSLFTYENPNQATRPTRPLRHGAAAPAAANRRRRRPQTVSLWSRIMGFFQEG